VYRKYHGNNHVPPRTHARGPAPRKLQADQDPIRLDRYCQTVPKDGWEGVKVRKTTKGWLRLQVHLTTVWMGDGEEPQARCRTLLITKTLSRKPKTTYSISNGTLEAYTPQQYAYFPAQRYWVERCLDDAKNELGLSDYQVRKWRGWHHHHALVMMACVFVLEETLQHETDTPLLSVRDARVLMIARFWGTQQDVDQRIQQMEKRHQKRQQAIDRHYRAPTNA
jgi:hypothetical protein